MEIIKTALLGATALSLTIGLGATTALAGGLNQNAQSIQHHGAGLPHLTPGNKAKMMSASVDADGTLVRGKGATGAESFSSGTYEVDFSKNVQSCTYVAGLGNATYGTAPPGFITDAARSGNPNGVWVEVWNPSGSNVAENFHLLVGC